MKKLAIFASILAIAVSCNVNEVETATVKAPTLYAYTESNDASTKTSISVDAEGIGTIWWKLAEKINVFFGTTSVPYTSTNTEDATTVVFETTAMIGSTEGSSSNKWGLYPYDADATCNGTSVTTTIPSTQSCVAETFGTNLFPMVAQTSDNELHFLNVCGGIKFSLSREDIQSITFKGNNDEDLAGRVQITLGTDGKPACSVVGGENTITLTPNSGDTFAKNTNYYIVMLPTVLSNGFTMTFETASQIGTFNYTTKSVEIKRSIFGKKANIDTYADFSSKEACPDAVDLGLSVKWASFNLGASSPSESGYYYRWGEVENRKSGKYSFDNGFYLGLTKYCTNSNYSSFGAIQDNLNRLLPEDDAASVMLGDNWRMPTKDEWYELMKCEWRWTTNYSGTYVNGFLVIGKNGNSIFIPASGYYKYSDIYDSGSRGYYWTSDLFTDPYMAYRADFYDGQHGTTGFERTNFLPVRAVYDDSSSKSQNNFMKY